VAVPPGHTALIRAEEFRLSARWLVYGFIAVLAAIVIVFDGMTAHIRTHRIERNLKRFCDFRSLFALLSEHIETLDFLLFHRKTSFVCFWAYSPFVFCFLCVRALARCTQGKA
jgi:hypothetical protein